PTLSVPADITAEATGPGGAMVSFEVTAKAETGATITSLTCTAPEDLTFKATGSEPLKATFQAPVGETTVECTAEDSNGEMATASFVVTVTATGATPEDEISQLIEEVSSSGIRRGIRNELTGLLSDALRSLEHSGRRHHHDHHHGHDDRGHGIDRFRAHE